MRLTIRLFAALRERAGCDSIVLSGVPEGATIDDLKRLASAAHPELGDLGAVAGVVGTRYAAPDSVVAGTDEVAFLPPVSGGGADDPPGRTDLPGAQARRLEEGVFELSAEPLDAAMLQARVAHPGCGAIVVFTGTTRDSNRGQAVARLDYEAFQEMSRPEMERIFAECLAAYGPASSGSTPAPSGSLHRLSLRMLAAHRIGTVKVGEPSVVIAVSSPHRDAAFLAARFLIDTLKERLPVWKKEVYGDGHHWIGDRS